MTFSAHYTQLGLVYKERFGLLKSFFTDRTPPINIIKALEGLLDVVKELISSK